MRELKSNLLKKKSLESEVVYKTLQQIVTEQLREAILNGTFKPSQRLDPKELASLFNTSQIPIREALRALEAEGLVKIYPHKKIVVAKMSSKEIEEIYAIRILLETKAATEALKRLKPEEYDRIKELEIEMEKTTGDLDAWVELNNKFHMALYELAGWPRMLRIISNLRNLTAPYVRLYVSTVEDMKAANAEHKAIVKAIEERDPTAVEIEIRNHLEHVCRGIVMRINEPEGQDEAERRALNI